MQTAGGLPASPAFFVWDESGASAMEYVLVASILVVIGGLMLLAVAKT